MDQQAIARAAKPEGVSLDQAMIAIYRANRSAFIADNINLIREGSKLAIPDAAAMTAIDGAEAGREVKLQATNFNQYRQKLAGAVRTVDDPRSGQTAAGSVGGKVTDRSGEAGGDQLKLSKPAAPGASAGAAGSQSSRAGEDEVARRNALREANSRITDLEKNVNDLQKLLELKNKSMADLQKQLDEARTQSKAVTGTVAPPAPKAEAPKVEPPKVEPPKPVEPPKAEMPKPVEPPKVEAIKPVEPPVAEAPKPVEPPKVEPPPPAPPKPVVKPPVAEAPAETSLVDDLLENPFLLPGLGGLALLGAGYGFFAMRRRRKVEKFEDSLIAADAFTANSLFGSTGGQSVDTSQSVFSTGAATGAVDVHSTEVDPIAEADVYIAYGREAQAEEILKEALKRQPDRQAIRAKLLEIYSGRKDARAFEALAREMYDMTDGRNEEWPKVATMGLSLDPNNPLYGGGAADDSPSPGAIAAGAAAVAAASASAAASARADLDFPEMPVSRTPEPAAATADDDIPSLDFDLNLDTRIDRAGDDGVSDTVSGPDYSAGSPADLGPSLDERFDLPSLDLDAKPGSRQADALDLDLPALEGLTQTGASQPDSGLDLSPISLDLEPATVAADEGEALSGGAGRWQEMATKLDLASAYEEIGDKEGARELLQEVIKGGDSGQQQKARAMLSKIG
ncbi:MAG: FimV/HubP family polar landmark protein [Burkholderiales bacterium]